MTSRKDGVCFGLSGFVLLSLMSLSLMSYGQAVHFTKDAIPVIEGRVVFEARFTDTLGKEIFHKRARSYLNDVLNPYSGNFRIDNHDFTVCQITDYINLENSLFQKFGMYMTYNLQLGYKDGVCSMVINSIHYVNKGSFEAHEKDPREKRRYRAWSGKEIMVDRSYSLMFIKNASERLTEASLKRINAIVAGLGAAFKESEVTGN